MIVIPVRVTASNPHLPTLALVTYFMGPSSYGGHLYLVMFDSHSKWLEEDKILEVL